MIDGEFNLSDTSPIKFIKEHRETPRDSEGRNQGIKDTVLLPLTEGEYIHVSTTSERLAKIFEEFADQFGHDGAKARAFFEEKVECRFGPINEIPIPYGNRLDDVISKIISSIQGRKPLGAIVATKDGKYIFCLDIQSIAKYLPKLRTKSFGIKNYSVLTTEQKIAAFQQAIKSFTEHEFFHILQYITNPEDAIKALRQVIWSQRISMIWANVAGASAIIFPPEYSFPIVASSGLATIGAVVYLNLNRRSVKIEEDAYDSQRKAIKLNLKNPFSFTPESIAKI